MSVSRHPLKSKKSSGTGLSRTLKSFKIETYKRLRRKGFGEWQARDTCRLTGPIPTKAFPKMKHRSGNVSGVIAKTFEENKRERFLKGNRSLGKGRLFGEG